MRRQPTGWTSRNPNGTYSARITYTDRLSRKRVNKKKSGFESDGAAADWLADQRKLIGVGVSSPARMTFNDLRDYYVANHAVEPVWKQDRLVHGMRSYQDARQRSRVLAEYLGPKPLRSIRYDDLSKLRRALLTRKAQRRGKGNAVVDTDRELSIGTVNRILTICHRMFNIAVRQGWLIENPFSKGEPLIRKTDEEPRERILTEEEERRLLAACRQFVSRGDAPRAQRWIHVRPIIVTALDTGMRFGELRALRWEHVDFEEGLIVVISRHTKTLKARFVGMTDRVTAELKRLKKSTKGGPKDSVFGVKWSVQRAWTAVRKVAGIEDFRFHDSRHTAATRLIRGGVPLQFVGKALGHTQAQTTLRYINPDKQQAKESAKMLQRGRKNKG